MTTYKDLVDETLNTLHGAVGDLEQVTALTVPLTTSSLSFTVDDASQVSRGLIEIDDELIWVKTSDRITQTITLAGAFARGWRQSAAATHASGAMVTNNPLFPRVMVKAALQEVLSAISPDVFVVANDETQTANAVVTTYPVPATANWILKAEWQAIGPSKAWRPVKRWRFDSSADPTAFPTGKSIDIYDAMTPGRTIKVTYAKDAGQLANDNDTLASVGLSEGLRDVLVYGAAARMLVNLEASRLQTNAVEQSDRDQVVAAGAATNAAKFFMQLYLTRLADEARALQLQYPATLHMTR